MSLPQSSFSSGIDLVVVDMRVLSGDRQVTDLRRDEIALSIDGRPRAIVSLDYRPADMANREGPPHRVVLVVDTDSIDRGEARQLERSARSFIRRLPKNVAVAVATLPIGGGITFEPDRAATLQALNAAFASTTRRGAGLEGMAAFGCDGAAASAGCGGLPVPGIDPRAIAMNRSAEWQHRGQATLQDLQWLFRTLGDVPSDVVLVSGGLPQDERLRPAVDRTLDLARRLRVRVHAITVADITAVALPQGGHDTLPTLESVESQRPATYGLPAETGGIEQSRVVSGKAFFTHLAAELAGSYQLAFEPLPSERDGRLHNIEMHVLRRPTPLVHARKTFVLPVPREPVRPPQPATETRAQPPPEPVPDAPPAAGRESGTGTEPARDAPLPDLIRRASAYVHTFEQTLSSVVAEERYVQIVKLWKGDPPKPGDEPELRWKPGTGEQRDRSAWQVLRRRQLFSDLLLVQPPGKIWIGFRDVADVNGTPVRDRSSRVKDLFLAGTLDAQQQLQRIADESARYNLGASRNINMPTFPLELLYPANVPRFEWKETRASETTSDGGRCTTVSFRETADPTMVRTDSGRNVPISGTVCIEPGTGRVWRMRLNFRQRLEHVEGAFEVVFRPSPRLSVLIPDRIWEWSLSHDPEWGGRPCFLEGQASYTNVRRFTVTTEEELK